MFGWPNDVRRIHRLLHWLPWPGYCMDMFDTYSKDNDGNACPNMCHTDCDYTNGETWCSNPPYNGCHNTGGYCMPKPSEDCYATCPVTCVEGEVLCPGGVNTYDNCPMPDYCLASWGDC